MNAFRSTELIWYVLIFVLLVLNVGSNFVLFEDLSPWQFIVVSEPSPDDLHQIYFSPSVTISLYTSHHRAIIYLIGTVIGIVLIWFPLPDGKCKINR